MNKLANMVIIEESIGDGFINENGKKVVSTKKRTFSRSKEWSEKNSGDETLKVLGDAYEVFSVIQGKKVRQVVTLEKAEQIEGIVNEPEKVEKKNTSDDQQKAKPGPKKKEEKSNEK